MSQQDWTTKNDTLEKEFTFQDFDAAWSFMSKVALIAQQMNHHPDWQNCWNKVTIRLSTHDAGNKVTEKDHQLAAAIDALI